jgi:glycosyltransferase involved in cell wall biosynthesis
MCADRGAWTETVRIHSDHFNLSSASQAGALSDRFFRVGEQTIVAVKLGIGVTTFNRCRKLEVCVSRVQELTSHPFHLVVADDGSTDATASICAQRKILSVTGQNRGIAWNKNRALFFLHQILQCDVVILIEDDCYPNNPGWERDWMAGAEKWGHINFGGDWFREKVLSGEGTIESPFVSPSLSGQCAAFSNRALSACGYLDSRFKGYGYEHAEHSARLVRAGFGGEMRMSEKGKLEPHYYLLAADLAVSSDESYRDEKSLAANWTIWEQMYGDPVYRHPWRMADEFRQFRKEMRHAAHSANFSLMQRLSLETQWRRWRRAPEAAPAANL